MGGVVCGSPNPFAARALVDLIVGADDLLGGLKRVEQESSLPCAQFYRGSQTKDLSYDHKHHPGAELIYRSLGFKAEGTGPFYFALHEQIRECATNGLERI